MDCVFCGSNDSSVENNVCSNCEEGGYLARASQTAVDQWVESRINHDYLRFNTLPIIGEKTFVIERDHANLPIEEKAHLLESFIVDYIQRVCSFYHRDDLLIGTITIREFTRIGMLRSDDEDPWENASEYIVATTLQSIIMSIPSERFLGASLEEYDSGYHGFISALALTRILTLLRENIERQRFFHFSDTVIDLVTELYENDMLEMYYDRLIKDGLDEKAEDLKINDENLRATLAERQILLEDIEASIQPEILRLFGVNFEDIRTVIRPVILSLESTPKIPIFIARKDIVKNEIGPDVSSVKINNVLKLFSLNQLFDIAQTVTQSQLELRSILETEHFVVCGRIDLMQNVSIFEKLVMSGHFLNMYTSQSLSSPLQKAQEKLATLFAYKVAESLKEKGFLLPMETVNGRRVVRAEIKSLFVSGEDILDGLGDIDVLALNPGTNELFNFELKYYKPSLSIGQLVSSDRDRIENKQTVTKVQRREAALREHLPGVVSQLGGNPGEYGIRSILLTIRANFYGFDPNLGIEYMTWGQLMGTLQHGLIYSSFAP